MSPEIYLEVGLAIGFRGTFVELPILHGRIVRLFVGLILEF